MRTGLAAERTCKWTWPNTANTSHKLKCNPASCPTNTIDITSRARLGIPLSLGEGENAWRGLPTLIQAERLSTEKGSSVFRTVVPCQPFMPLVALFWGDSWCDQLPEIYDEDDDEGGGSGSRGGGGGRLGRNDDDDAHGYFRVLRHR